MREFLLSLLPPWNLARLFSSYRLLEEENAALGNRIQELEDEKKAQWDYILMLRGAPPLAPREKKESSLEPIRPRPGLRSIRRKNLLKVMEKRLEPVSENKPASDNGSMAERADRYVAAASAGHSEK